MSRNHTLSALALASLFLTSSAVIGCEEREERPQGIERLGHEIDDAVEDVEDGAEDLGEDIDESLER